MSEAFERFRYSFFEGKYSARDGLDTMSLARLEGEERATAEDLLIRYLPDARGIIGLGVLRSHRAEPRCTWWQLFENEHQMEAPSKRPGREKWSPRRLLMWPTPCCGYGSIRAGPRPSSRCCLPRNSGPIGWLPPRRSSTRRILTRCAPSPRHSTIPTTSCATMRRCAPPAPRLAGRARRQGAHDVSGDVGRSGATPRREAGHPCGRCGTGDRDEVIAG